jgi:AcrR family transcriptional regulator
MSIPVSEQPEGEGNGHERSLRADARRNRDRILRTAWRMLTRDGVQHFEMDNLAHEAEIAKGTLYRHYSNREELFTALVNDAADHLVAALRDSIPPEADALTKLRTFIDVLYRSYDEANVSLDVMLGLRPPTTRDVQENSSFAEIPRRLRNILMQGVREGVFHPTDVDFTVLVVLSLVNPFVTARAQQRLGYDSTRLRALAFDTICRALGVAPQGSSITESESTL